MKDHYDNDTEPEQSDIMQLFELMNNPSHDDDHVTVLDLANARFESTDSNNNSNK